MTDTLAAVLADWRAQQWATIRLQVESCPSPSRTVERRPA